MKTPFKDSIAYKQRKTSSPFAAPTKEQATTGRFMDAGDNYGVGHRNPIGAFKQSNETPIPQKSVCFPSE